MATYEEWLAAETTKAVNSDSRTPWEQVGQDPRTYYNQTVGTSTQTPTEEDGETNSTSVPVRAENLAIQSPEQQASTLAQVAQNVTDPQVPEAGVQTYTGLQDTPDQFMTGEGQTVAPTTTVDTTQAQPAPTVQDPEQVEAATYQPALITSQMSSGDAAANAVGQMVDEDGNLTDVGAGGAGVTAPSMFVEAATADLPAKALMSTQLNQLLEGLEGGSIPAWARPAVEAVEGALAARGMSKSTVGRDALFNAIIQSALPIAQANAQAELTRAEHNLTNEQQARLANQQVRMTTMLSDQAATNASRQFNASSQNQVDMFMSNLQTNVEQFNTAQLNAMEQFNAGEANAMEKFAEQVQFQRESFNATMYNAIEQSNVQWRRQMNQIDTAGLNAVNQANAINAFNLSNQALTLMWQDLRDSASWAFQAAENDQERNTRMAMAALTNESNADRLETDTWAALGSWVANIID